MERFLLDNFFRIAAYIVPGYILPERRARIRPDQFRTVAAGGTI